MMHCCVKYAWLLGPLQVLMHQQRGRVQLASAGLLFRDAINDLLNKKS